MFSTRRNSSLIYLDHSATTPPDPEVLDAFMKVNQQYWFNPASIHEAGAKTQSLLESARKQIAALLKTDHSYVVFTSGGTESNNYVLFGTAKELRHRGNHILLSAVEHPSVREVGLELERQGFVVEWIDVDESGQIRLEDLENKLRPTTILVSIQYVNNEVGTIQPINKAASIIKSISRAMIHVDAVQAYGKLSVDFDELDVDWVTLSSHKFNGIKGTGIAAARDTIHIPALLQGGGQEFGHRSGTVAVAQAVATSKAMRIAAESKLRVFEHLTSLQKNLRVYFDSQPLVRVLTPIESSPHVMTVAVRGITGEVLVNALEKHDIFVSTSSACSSKRKSTSHVLTAMQVHPKWIDGVIRISMGKSTTLEEINEFKLRFSTIVKQLERNLMT